MKSSTDELNEVSKQSRIDMKQKKNAPFPSTFLYTYD